MNRLCTACDCECWKSLILRNDDQIFLVDRLDLRNLGKRSFLACKSVLRLLLCIVILLLKEFTYHKATVTIDR